MSDPDNTSPGPTDGKADRKARAADALRANLHRRKAQARARRQSGDGSGPASRAGSKAEPGEDPGT